MTLSKTKSKYNGLVEVRLSGYEPGYQITVRWPGGAVIAQTRADAAGNAVTSFRTPPVWLGNYLIRATDQAGNVSTATFRVIPRVVATEAIAAPGSSTQLDLYGFDPGHEVDVRWYDGQHVEVIATVTVDARGQATTFITVPLDASPGRHLIRAKVVGVSRSVTTTIVVTSRLASGEDPTSVPTASPTPAGTPAITATPMVTVTPDISVTPTATGEPTELPTVEPTPSEVATETATAVEPTATPPILETPTEVVPTPGGYRVVHTSHSPSSGSGTTAVDDNPATVWETTDGEDPGQTAVLTLELESDLPIGEVRLLPAPSGLSGKPTIETSDDGETWSFYAEPDVTLVDEGGWIRVVADPEITGPVSGRFVRIVFENPGGSPSLGGLAEIEVMPPESFP